ncbi:hypothetical protein CW304_07125 [Bacillus sp. UFRGS-B20]|nr:hypothetical protein CW304_07125 [Bacillus sp. UFRGS-B20]
MIWSSLWQVDYQKQGDKYGTLQMGKLFVDVRLQKVCEDLAKSCADGEGVTKLSKVNVLELKRRRGKKIAEANSRFECLVKTEYMVKIQTGGELLAVLDKVKYAIIRIPIDITLQSYIGIYKIVTATFSERTNERADYKKDEIVINV